ARGDTQDATARPNAVEVSIRAPARGATEEVVVVSCDRQGFNPRPCARGDRNGLGRRGARAVSIRAPARGATPVPRPDLERRAAFQSAPLREGRRSRRSSGTLTPQFQSAPLREGRHRTERAELVLLAVSIRAPARGATPASGPPAAAAGRFNP